MAEKIIFKVNKREVTGKKVKALRKTGLVPGVVYGAKHAPLNIEAENNALEKVIEQAGFSTPVNLEVDGKKYFTVIKNIARDTVKRNLVNIEFQSISAKDPIDAEVEIVLAGQGESPAERAGLVVMQVLEHVELRALPNDMPAELSVALDQLTAVGDRITLGDIKLPKGVEFTDKEIDLTLAVANVYDPAQLEAQNEATGGDDTQDVAEVEADNGAEETTDEAKTE